MFMETVKEMFSPMDFINQSNAAIASYNSAIPIDLSKYKRALFVISIGVMNTAATFDARLQTAVNANFNAGVHNIASTNIAQITNAAANTNIKKTIEIRSDQVAQANPGDKFVRLNCTVAGSTVNFEVVGYGVEPVQKPSSQNVNTTIVTEQVVAP